MKKVFSLLLCSFYIIIIMYVFFAIIHINTLPNFMSAMAFEIIGFFALVYFIFCNMFSASIKVGFFVPLIMVTIIYLVLLNIINIAFVAIMNSVLFVLFNFILLFIYCLVSIPMYLMGKR